jgi:hypothetical protein
MTQIKNYHSFSNQWLNKNVQEGKSVKRALRILYSEIEAPSKTIVLIIFKETQSVNVVVLDRQRNFPGFFSPRTEFLAPHCTESVKEVAQILGQFGFQ